MLLPAVMDPVQRQPAGWTKRREVLCLTSVKKEANSRMVVEGGVGGYRVGRGGAAVMGCRIARKGGLTAAE